MFVQKRKKIMAAEEIEKLDIDVDVDEVVEEPVVDPEVTDLLFEAPDVAELVAEITGAPVEVTSGEDGEVIFSVGEEEFTVTADGDEEILEASKKVACGCDDKKDETRKRRDLKAAKSGKIVDRSAVKASVRRCLPAKSVKASKVIRKLPRTQSK